jgi:hypothetical protein
MAQSLLLQNARPIDGCVTRLNCVSSLQSTVAVWHTIRRQFSLARPGLTQSKRNSAKEVICVCYTR